MYKQKYPAHRDIHIVDAANNVGLADIQLRSDTANKLPPRQFFKLARREIVISAITAFRTFDEELETLITALKNNVEVKVVILDSNAHSIINLSEKEKRDIKEQVKQVCTIITANKLDRFKNFQIRFADKLPAFTSIMIDGDIESTFTKNEILNPVIRVQPIMQYMSHKDGVILEFCAQTDTKGAFYIFSADLKQHWLQAVQ